MRMARSSFLVLINAHSHIAMTLLRGIAEDLVLDKWLEEVWKYELAPLSEDDVLAGSKLGLCGDDYAVV